MRAKSPLLCDPNRRRLLSGAAAGIAGALVAPWVWAAQAGYSKRAISIVERSGAIDMLGLVTINEEEWERWNSAEGMTDTAQQQFKECGIKVFHHSFGLGGPNSHTDALVYFAGLNAFIARYSDTFTRVSRWRDLEALVRSPKVGVIPGLQNSEHFRTPDDVKLFYSLGQRVSMLTYNAQNNLGCGSTERRDCGVSDFGAAIIQKMNETSMLVDVSHCGDMTTLDAFELSKKPVAITHSNCRALVNHPRCKTDEAIRKMAASGGVMGITGVRMFVRSAEPTTIEHIVDHVDHVAKLVGVEYVGVGSDCDLSGYDKLPEAQGKALRAAYKASYAFREKLDIEEFGHPRKIFDLTEALLRRGYGEADVVGVLGGNFRRMFKNVWEY
jgi:membrane dipeptidase